MAAVQAILSTLSGLAQARDILVRERGWRRPAAAAQVAMPVPWEGEYAHAGQEPLLEDLLSDPVIRSVMRADGVQPAELTRLLGRRPPPIVL